MKKLLGGGAASAVATLTALASGPLAVVIVIAGCFLMGVIGVVLLAAVFFDRPSTRVQDLIRALRTDTEAATPVQVD